MISEQDNRLNTNKTKPCVQISSISDLQHVWNFLNGCYVFTANELHLTKNSPM